MWVPRTLAQKGGPSDTMPGGSVRMACRDWDRLCFMRCRLRTSLRAKDLVHTGQE